MEHVFLICWLKFFLIKLLIFISKDCEILQCDNEPGICSTIFDASVCATPIYNSFCPKLCGYCNPATTTTTTIAPTTTTTTITTTTTTITTTTISFNCVSGGPDDIICGAFTKLNCVAYAVAVDCPRLCQC